MPRLPRRPAAPRPFAGPRRYLALVFALLALTAVAAACSGDDTRGDSTAVAADAAVAQDAVVVLVEPEDIESYRFAVTMELSGAAAGSGAGALGGIELNLDISVSMEGAFAAPDRLQTQLNADLGFLNIDVETISIGDRTWTRFGDEPWSEQSTGGGGEFSFELSPASFLGGSGSLGDETSDLLTSMRGGLSGFTWTPDAVNGIATDRYDLTIDEFSTAVSDLDDLIEGIPEGDGFVTIWLAEGSGILVRLTLDVQSDDGAGHATIQFDFFDFNSDDIVIEQPLPTV